jgi:pimeloyl-ACP methyl ester carboxylesterase
VTARPERFTTPALAGVSLHAIHRGEESRRKLVLLHGGGANSHWWDHIAEPLAEHFHVVALDFRGHGDSDYPATLEPGAFHRDLEALLEHLGAPDAALMGHSMGGHVALGHAARNGAAQGPRALVAVDVVRGVPSRERRITRLALAVRRSYRTRQEAITRYRFLPPAPHAAEELRRHVAEHSVREEGARFAFKFDPRWFGLPPEPPPDLTSVTAPTLIVRGVESTLLSAEGAASFASEIAGAAVVEIEGAGHNVHLERPAEFLDAVTRFLIAKDAEDAA